MRGVLVGLTALFLVPVAAWASNTFVDVPDSSTFHDDIDWMVDEGVTRGCNPPAGDRFCPDDFVTRAQMSAFLHRLETEDVFTTLEEMDGLLPIATVAVTRQGNIQQQDFRAPVQGVSVERILSATPPVDLRYELTVSGISDVQESRIVCTPDSTETRMLSVVKEAPDKYLVRLSNENGTLLETAFDCAIYG